MIVCSAFFCTNKDIFFLEALIMFTASSALMDRTSMPLICGEGGGGKISFREKKNCK